jgi:hypothetical protein
VPVPSIVALRTRLSGVPATKMTLAAVIAYAAAEPLSHSGKPVLAPLTALLVAQVTLYKTLWTGLRRVVSVVSGVLLAVLFAFVVPLNALTLGAIVAAALVLGALLRLQDELLEVPISAMLVLAVGGVASLPAAESRVFETIIGAVVGVVVSALVAPPVFVRPAGTEVRELALQTAALLCRMADEVDHGYTAEQAVEWLHEARRLDHGISRVDAALLRADESARLNPRTLPRAPGRKAFGTVPPRRAKVTLRTGLDALERVEVAVRGVSRILGDWARDAGEEQAYDEEIRRRLASTLRAIAKAVDLYGDLVCTEVLGGEAKEPALARTLTAAWQEVSDLSEALRADRRLHEGAWELHGALVAQFGRLLRDIDVDNRVRMRESWEQVDSTAVRRQLRNLRRRRTDRPAPVDQRPG